jgi:hypothetical protein
MINYAVNFQVDNQMCEAQCPVVVYVPNSGRAEDFNNLPVIEISAERIVSEHHNIDTIKVSTLIYTFMLNLK